MRCTQLPILYLQNVNVRKKVLLVNVMPMANVLAMKMWQETSVQSVKNFTMATQTVKVCATEKI